MCACAMGSFSLSKEIANNAPTPCGRWHLLWESLFLIYVQISPFLFAAKQAQQVIASVSLILCEVDITGPGAGEAECT